MDKELKDLWTEIGRLIKKIYKLELEIEYLSRRVKFLEEHHPLLGD